MVLLKSPASGLWKKIGVLVLCFGFLAALADDKPQPDVYRHSPPPGADSLSKPLVPPLHFEPNAGQTDSQIEFLSRGPGFTLFLSRTQAVLSLQTGERSRELPTSAKKKRSRENASSYAQLRMVLCSANPQPHIEGVDKLEGIVNYFIGDDPKKWRTDIPTFAKVKYEQVYPGIDLVYYGNQRQLEYDFVVSPNANADHIAFNLEGTDRIEIDGDGNLVAHIAGRTVRWKKPFAYQTTESGCQEVAANFVINDNGQIGFRIAPYDTSKPLVIDPALVYSTYLGGSADDLPTGIAVNWSGNVFVVGDTTSPNFPTLGGVRSTPAGLGDVFVTKLNSNGTALVYSTYLGGTNDEFSGGIAIDSAGNAYVTGATRSGNFPTASNPYSTTFNSSRSNDVFVTKINANGNNLLYSSYLGGGDDDFGDAIAVDNSGNVYIAGDTYSLGTGSASFPTKPSGNPKAYQTQNAGGQDVFVAKFDTTANGQNSLVYSTFLGGSTDEKANAIAIDTNGNAYIVGDIFAFSFYPTPPASDFPVLNAFQSSFNRGSTDPLAGSFDGFLTKMNPGGTALIFSTYLGGLADDRATAVAVDGGGRVYVAGETSSLDFPVTNAAQSVISGASSGFPRADAFLSLLQSNGTSLAYSTFLGGYDYESGFYYYRFGLAADNFGLAYITGETASVGTGANAFPTTQGADQTNRVSFTDAFVSKINPAVPGPPSLIYSTLIGGDQDERGTAVAVDTNGNFYVAGFTYSSTFPVSAGAVRATNSGAYDGFIAKFSSPADLSVSMKPSVETAIIGSNVTLTVQVNNNGRTSFNNITNTVQLATNTQIKSVSSTAGTWTTDGSKLTFSLGTLTNNAQVSHTIVIAATTLTRLTNVATLTSSGTEINNSNNVAIALTTVRGIANVVLTNYASQSSVFVSSNITFVTAITNTGPYTATSVVVTNTLPAAVQFVVSSSTQGSRYLTNNNATLVANIGSLAVGASAIVTVTARAITSGNATNRAGVTSFELDAISANNTGQAVFTVNPLADLSLSKTASTNNVFAGSNLVYTVIVTNRGPSTATGIVVTDPLPAGSAFVSATSSSGTATQTNGVVTANISSLNSNSIVTVTITVRPYSAGTNNNTATVSSAVTDPVATNNTASISTVVTPNADMTVRKTASTNAVFAGNNLTYTIAITNRGPSTALAASLSDPLPPSAKFVSAQTTRGTLSTTNNGQTTIVSCDLGNLLSNATATITIIARPVLNGLITNIVGVSSATADLVSTNNSSALTTTVNPATDLAISQFVSPNPVLVASNVNFVVTVRNNGPLSASGVFLTNTLAPGLTFVGGQSSQGSVQSVTYSTNGAAVTATIVANLGTLASNATATVTLTANSGAIGYVTNTARVSSALTDTVSTNNSSAITASFVDAVADLVITKEASTNTLSQGQDLTYTISVTNLGPPSVPDVVVTDPLPAGATFVSAQSSQGVCAQTNGIVTGALGTLNINDFATVTIVVRPTVPGPLTNSATVTSSLADLAPSNNTTSVVTSVDPITDLAISKTAVTNSVFAGQDLTYTLLVTNHGPSSVTNVVVTDPLPLGSSFVLAQSSQGLCTFTNGTLTCELGALDTNAAAAITLSINSALVGTITNTAIVSSELADLITSNSLASAVATVLPTADIVVSQTAPPTVLLTSNITFNVLVSNAGPSLATSVVVTNTLPGGVTFVSAIADQGTCIESNGVVMCDIGDMDNGAPVNVSITVKPLVEGNIANVADAISSRPDLVPSNNSAIATAFVAPIADLGITKQLAPSQTNSVLIGDSIAYGLTVTNCGLSSAANVAVADPLPDGLGLVSAQVSQGNYEVHVSTNPPFTTLLFRLGTLESNAAATISIVTTGTVSGTFTNTASIGSDVFDFDSANNVASAAATVNPAADLEITKGLTTTGGMPTNAVIAGDDCIYVISVTNLGPSSASNVTVVDTLAASTAFVFAQATSGTIETATNGQQVTVTLQITSLAAGEGALLSITLNPSQAGSLTNTVTTASITGDPNPANNTASVIASVIPPSDPLADLVISKAASTNTILIGSNLTFTIAVTNHGPQSAANAQVIDALPSQLEFVSAMASQGAFSHSNGIVTFTLGTLTNNATVNLTLVAKAVADGSITNSAGAVSTTTDPVLDNNSASAIIAVTPVADVALSKTVSTNSALIGEALTYTILVTNSGPSTATGLLVSDTLPPGMTFVSAQTTQGNYNQTNNVVISSLGALAANASATVNITVNAITEGVATNIASVISDVLDFSTDNNTAAALATVSPTADLVLTKLVTTNAVVAGSNVVYTLVVSNRGPSSAGSVTVTDPLPSSLTFISALVTQGSFEVVTNAGQHTVTFNAGALNASTSATLTLTAETASGAAGTTITNTADINSATGDPAPGNNSASVATSVIQPSDPLADLVLAKSASTNSILLGSNVTFTITVTNRGPDPANAHIADTLPGKLQFVSATTSQGTFNHTDGVVTFTLGTLASNATAVLTVTATAVADGSATNFVSVNATTTDPLLNNNTASAIVAIAPVADVVISKAASTNLVLIGGSLTYTITASNCGPSTAGGVLVTDALPSGTAFVTAQTSQGNYSQTNGTLLASLGALTSNAAATITITVNTLAEGPTTNTALLTSDVLDFTTDNNSASAIVTVAPTADLTLIKLVTTNVVAAGSNLVYTLIVSNRGPSTAASVTVTDALPAALTFISAQATQGVFQVSTNAGQHIVAFDGGSLLANASATLTITAKTATNSAGSTITNTATLASTTGDPNAGNNTASILVSAIQPSDPLADLAITKSAATNTALIGDNLSFAISITNRGPQPALNAVLTDPLPPQFHFLSATASQGTFSETNGILTFALGDLTNGAAATLTLDVNVAGDGQITNTAVIASATTDPVSRNNTASAAATVIPLADIRVSKAVSSNTVLRGSELVYTLAVSNQGPSAATSLVLTDALPAGVAFASAQLSQGNFQLTTNNSQQVLNVAFGAVNPHVTATATLRVSTIAEGSVLNIAAATSPVQDPAPDDNAASALANVLPVANLQFLKMQVAPTAAFVSSNVLLTIIATNAGPSAAEVTVTNHLAGGTEVLLAQTTRGSYELSTLNSNSAQLIFLLGTMGAGETATMTVLSRVTTPGVFTNTANISSPALDLSPQNNFASAVQTNVALAEVELLNIASTNSTFVGSNLTFTIYAVNHGPSVAKNVVVTDVLPASTSYVSSSNSHGSVTFNGPLSALTNSIGDLALNETATLIITVNCPTAALLINRASETSSTADPIPENNSAAAEAAVNATQDISVVKRLSSSAVFTGSNVTFTITVTNNGLSTATGILLTDAMPEGLKALYALTSDGVSFTTTNAIICALDDLPALGGHASVTVFALPTDDGVVTNTATVTAAETDLNPTNNLSAVELLVLDNPDAPILRVKQFDNDIVLAWTTNLTDFILETKPDLDEFLTWETVTNVPSIIGTRFVVTNSLSAGPHFYRLKK